MTKDGKEMEIEARVGMTVLKAALRYNAPIEGISQADKFWLLTFLFLVTL